jgi:hypothetical protein
MKFFAQQTNCSKKISASILGEQTIFEDQGYTQ